MTISGFAVNGITNVIISTLERRYNLPSTKSSFISNSYDFGAGFFVLPITYFGAKGHQVCDACHTIVAPCALDHIRIMIMCIIMYYINFVLVQAPVVPSY